MGDGSVPSPSWSWGEEGGLPEPREKTLTDVTRETEPALDDTALYHYYDAADCLLLKGRVT